MPVNTKCVFNVKYLSHGIFAEQAVAPILAAALQRAAE
jgi:hypothetical protein